MNFPLEVKIMLSIVLYLSLFFLLVRAKLIDTTSGFGTVLGAISGWLIIALYILAAVCIWRFL